jgi:hypothetical protein
MPFTLMPLAGLFDADEIAAMTAVLDELCAEAPARGWMKDIPESQVRSAIGRLIVELQSGAGLSPAEIRNAAIKAMEASSLVS